MAAVSIDAPQGFILGAADSSTDVFTPQAYVLAAGSYSADSVVSTQLFTLVAGERPTNIFSTQAFVLVAARGRVTDPAIRVWTYTLDGHDFYVLRLGNEETLVCDLTTKQWATYGSGETGLWRAYSGTNWIGADSIAGGYGSNIVVGDDGNGALYFLNPDKDTDDDASAGSDVPRTFHRAVMGQIATKGYDAVRCFGMTVSGSIGNQADETMNTVSMSYSDDSGRNYTDAGDITITPGEYYTRLNWRSLGSYRYPGRLFKVEDHGALKRLDDFEVEDGA